MQINICLFTRHDLSQSALGKEAQPSELRGEGLQIIRKSLNPWVPWMEIFHVTEVKGFRLRRAIKEQPLLDPPHACLSRIKPFCVTGDVAWPLIQELALWPRDTAASGHLPLPGVSIVNLKASLT